jgi:hypothetical protein
VVIDKRILIYIEGGGDTRKTKDPLTKGFRDFLKELFELADKKRFKMRLILCGGRKEAFDDFEMAMIADPTAFNVLLIDSEAPVATITEPWQHLKSRVGDEWAKSANYSKESCHLMVQTMEAWFMADQEAVANYYGKGFQKNALPKNLKIEEIPKSDLEPKLKKAASETKKGEYQKIDHGSELLSRISAQKVRDASPACERLFQTLAGQMGETI